MQKRDWAGALDNFNIAFRKNPKDLWPLHKIVDCLLAAGKIESAAERLEELALRYEDLGRHRKALAVWKRVSDLSPSGDALIAVERVEAAMHTPVLMGTQLPEQIPSYGLDIVFED